VIRKALGPAKHRALRLYHRAASLVSTPNPKAVMGLGNQKSGTTAIVALLARHTNSSVTLDLPDIAGPVKIRMKTGEISFQSFVRRNASYLSRDIIKEPNLTFFYDELKRAFPQARYLMIVRDPRQNIRSILNRLELPGNLATLDDHWMDRVHPNWKADIEGKWLGLKGRNYIEVLAARWNLSADVYLEHRADMVLLRYEDFSAAKAAVIADVAPRLGLEGRKDITGEVDRQYQPRGNRSIPVEAFFGPDNLRLILSSCGERMSLLGYSP
jgi:Sulfotransferase family